MWLTLQMVFALVQEFIKFIRSQNGKSIKEKVKYVLLGFGFFILGLRAFSII